MVETYAKRLASEGLVPPAETEKLRTDFWNKLENEFEASEGFKPNKADWLDGRWSGITQAEEGPRRGDTAVSIDRLKSVGAKLTEVPKGFTVHKTIERLLSNRRKMIDERRGIDWSMGEALAFGTLLLEGLPVRLSGQDVERGTFSQRHAALTDQNNENQFIPLNHVSPGQARFEVYQLAAVRRGGAGLRIRLQPRRAQRARAVGSAIRRFRERRASDHRPVPRQRRTQMAAHVRP